MGTTKAGDLLEAFEGKRPQRDVRELCPKCATHLMILLERGGHEQTLHMAFGFATEPIAA